MSYNGWSNYATFRVHNDILIFRCRYGIAFEDTVSIDDLREIVTNTMFGDTKMSHILEDYANLFLDTVNWSELAETYNNDI